MRSGKEAVELLISKDFTFAKEKSDCIDQYNEERKDLDKKTTGNAKPTVEEPTDTSTDSRNYS